MKTILRPFGVGLRRNAQRLESTLQSIPLGIQEQ